MLATVCGKIFVMYKIFGNLANNFLSMLNMTNVRTVQLNLNLTFTCVSHESYSTILLSHS